jgi:hypothetical protein
MHAKYLFFPVFVQVLLTLGLLGNLGRMRAKAVKNREVKMREVALGQTEPWPEGARAAARSFQNQLEVPVLFYAWALSAMVLARVNLPIVVLAWLFVATRLAHAGVHTGSNKVSLRFQLFFAGVIVLTGAWVYLAVLVALQST